MKRRDFIVLLGGTTAAWPFASRAEPRKTIPRIGVLWHAANAKEEEEYLSALTRAFHDAGYFEGKNIELDSCIAILLGSITEDEKHASAG
jgi:putative ABC transport system substrate-binding protein